MSNRHRANRSPARSAERSSGTQQRLHHTSINSDSSKGTILFIHGAYSAEGGWDLVTPYLQDYHILLPALPGHGKSSHIRPFTLSSSAELIADLIRREAQHGKAHVVGLSLGAYVGIALACQQSDVVDTMLISGVKVYPTSDFMRPLVPYVTWASGRLDALVPKAVVSWAMDGTDLEQGNQGDFSLSREVSVVLNGRADFNRDCNGQAGKGLVRDGIMWPEPWAARTLIVAAGKSGIIPSADHFDYTKKIADIGAQENPSTKAVVHRQMRHPWHRQDGPLFARLVRAWIEEGKVVEGFEALPEGQVQGTVIQ